MENEIEWNGEYFVLRFEPREVQRMKTHRLKEIGEAVDLVMEAHGLDKHVVHLILKIIPEVGQ